MTVGELAFLGKHLKCTEHELPQFKFVLPYVVLNSLEFAKEADPQQNTHVAYQASHLANTDR